MLHFIEFTAVHSLLLLTSNKGQKVFESPSRHWVIDRVTPQTVHWSITGHTHNIHITFKFRLHVERVELESNFHCGPTWLHLEWEYVCAIRLYRQKYKQMTFTKYTKGSSDIQIALTHTPKNQNKNNKNPHLKPRHNNTRGGHVLVFYSGNSNRPEQVVRFCWYHAFRFGIT